MKKYVMMARGDNDRVYQYQASRGLISLIEAEKSLSMLSISHHNNTKAQIEFHNSRGMLETIRFDLIANTFVLPIDIDNDQEATERYTDFANEINKREKEDK